MDEPAVVPIVIAIALTLAGCPSKDSGTTPSAAPKPAAPAGALFVAPPPSDPYAGPPRCDAPVTALPSGLRVQEVKVGTGPAAVAGKTTVVNYLGWLGDGRTFDSTRKSGPFELELGSGKVIKGWDEGIVGMRVGGIRRLIVPPELGYGNQRSGRVPPGSTLTFDVELLEQR